MTSYSVTTSAELAEPQPAAGFGALETAQGCLPLVSLDVRAKVVGLDVAIAVRQEFRNPSDQMLEATYIFPLPDRLAVTGFEMQVGERVIRGVLKERGEARADYQAGLRAGHRVALAEEDRSGVFTISVGNLPPGETIEVRLNLVGPLPVADGEATFRFPLVVAPRYTPGVPLDGRGVGQGTSNDTDLVPDASRVSPQVLLPGFPNPVRLSLEVVLDQAAHEATLAGLRSALHNVIALVEGPDVRVRLQPAERLNRDFVLRFPVTGTTLEASGVMHHDTAPSGDSTFAVTIVPPRVTGPTRSREIVFLLDRSGSMGGWKMVAARRAVERMIESLGPADALTVLAFDHGFESPPTGPSLVPGGFAERTRIVDWLRQVESRGGTELGPALDAGLAALRGRRDDSVEQVLVLITDGQVAGEDHVLATLSQGPTARLPRMFCLGIDRAINFGLLNRLADATGGSTESVDTEADLNAVMDRIHRQLATPVLSDVVLKATSGTILPDSQSPERLPAVFEGLPLAVFGRLRGQPEAAKVEVSARLPNGQPWSTEVALRRVEHPALMASWGRRRVRALEDRYAMGFGDDVLYQQTVAVSLAAGVLSRFTAFVAVDTSEVVNPGGECDPMVQPVELPDGWASSGPEIACAAPILESPSPRSARLFAAPASYPREAPDADDADMPASAVMGAPLAMGPPSEADDARQSPLGSGPMSRLELMEVLDRLTSRVEHLYDQKVGLPKDLVDELTQALEELACEVSGEEVLEQRVEQVLALVAQVPRRWRKARYGDLIEALRKLVAALRHLPDPNQPPPAGPGRFWA